MPEQQQDVDGEQHRESNILLEKKPIPTSKHTTKIHKTKHRHRRYNKYPSSRPISQAIESVVPNTIDDTPPALEETSMQETMVDTPQPSSAEETKETSVAVAELDIETDPAVPAIAKETPVAEPVVPTTPAIVEETDNASLEGQGDRKSLPYIFAVAQRVGKTFIRGQGLFSWHRTLFYIFLILLLTNTILLWQSLTATHLYANTLNASNGNLQTQQDLGSYRDAIRLTAPLAVNDDPASAVLGVYTSEQGGTQQLLTLRRTASSLSFQHSVSLINGAITQAANGRLLAESADGLQVVTQNGQVAWHIQGKQPTSGVHPFTPASDTETVYTIASVIHSQIAAYALTNGRVRWTQTLPDTLKYAPPFLVDGDTLYVASDSNIFAINSNDGSVRWEKPYAARTLLLENEGQQHLLLALGPQGIQALQSDAGEVAWSFRGDPLVSTLPTQFYQGTMGHALDTGSNTLYATGVVWHMPTVREDVWLYAIDATTGMMRWSQQIASGSTGVDAGRVLQPLLDTQNGIIIVQRALQKNVHAVTAYDAQTGRQRWNTPVTNMNTSSPTVFQLSKNTFAVFTTTTSSTTILWTPSFYRTCLLLLLLVSILGLLLLLFLPRTQGRARIQRIAHVIKGLHPLRRQGDRKDFPYIFGGILVCVCIGTISIFAYIRSSQPEYQLLATDAQGSVVTTATGDNMQQLEALHSNGTRQWTLFSSEGSFSVPKAQTQAGTLLVALHGNTMHTYVVAQDDPAYPHPLDDMLALYLLNRTTGNILWQQVVSYPDEQQKTEVIGVDATYIYVAGEHTLTTSTQTVQVPQLFAVNKLTGTVDWRIFGPTQLANKQSSPGTLLIKNGQVFWQVADTVFTIDTNVGQIIGRK